RGDPVGVREPCQHLAVSPLALACLSFGAFARGQIEHEGDALTSAFFEGRDTDQNGHAASILPEIFLLEWLQDPGRLELSKELCVAVAPLPGSDLRPAQATRDKILTIMSDHAKKRVICLQNPACQVPDEDPDDVGFDQASDLRF